MIQAVVLSFSPNSDMRRELFLNLRDQQIVRGKFKNGACAEIALPP
jgi:hypothetical protein